MNRLTWKYLVVCLVVVVALLCGGVQQANAHWHGCCGYGWGGWGGCGWGGCGWGGWGGGCGWGGCGGWGGGGCGWGGWGYGCHHHYCGCGDCCGCWPACPVVVSSCCDTPVIGGPVIGGPVMGGYGAPVMVPPATGAPVPGAAPAVPTTPTPAPALPENPPGIAPPVPGAAAPGAHTNAAPVALGSGQLTIVVPADAKVFINGHQTRSIGTHREYVSYGLESGLTYRYEVRAEVVRDGKTVEDTREVFLSAGSREGVAFDFAAKKAVSVASL